MIYFDSSSRENSRSYWKSQSSQLGPAPHSVWTRELDWMPGVHAQLRGRYEDKRNHDVVRRLLDEAGNNNLFTPIVMSACGAMGPSMVAFLKVVSLRPSEGR